MARLTIEVTPDALADLLGELAPEHLRQGLTALANRIEVREWMAASASLSWGGSDFYDVQRHRPLRPGVQTAPGGVVMAIPLIHQQSLTLTLCHSRVRRGGSVPWEEPTSSLMTVSSARA